MIIVENMFRRRTYIPQSPGPHIKLSLVAIQSLILINPTGSGESSLLRLIMLE
jgi:hypothetical protein